MRLIWRLTWLGRVQRILDQRLVDEGEVEVQLRIPVCEMRAPEYLTPLFDELNKHLAAPLEGRDGDRSPAGRCGQAELSEGILRYYLVGRDADDLIAGCRSAAALFPVPEGAYIWRPAKSDPSVGYLSPL